jgi:hypothetical protein
MKDEGRIEKKFFYSFFILHPLEETNFDAEVLSGVLAEVV